jgi:hypothetical protein
VRVTKRWILSDESKSSQGQIGPMSKTWANDEAKPDMEKGLEVVVAEQSKVQWEKASTKIEARTSSQQLPNWTI